MSIGVTKDYKLKVKNLHASHKRIIGQYRYQLLHDSRDVPKEKKVKKNSCF